MALAPETDGVPATVTAQEAFLPNGRVLPNWLNTLKGIVITASAALPLPTSKNTPTSPPSSASPTATAMYYSLVAFTFLYATYLLVRALRSRLSTRPSMPPVPSGPFRFLELPAELRNMVYEHLLQDPYYAARPSALSSSSKTSRRRPRGVARNSSLWSNPLSLARPTTSPYFPFLSLPAGRRGRRRAAALDDQHEGNCCVPPGPKSSSWIILANKRVHAEFMDLLAKKRMWHFTVSTANCPDWMLVDGSSLSMPTFMATPTPTASISPSTSSSSFNSAPITRPAPTLAPFFPLPLSTFSSLTHITLHLLTTSSMLGSPDPRAMSPSSWPLAQHLQSALQTSLCPARVKRLEIHVKAVGDPLWNPLWVWFHAAMGFVGMGENDEGAIKVSKIYFSLDNEAADTASVGLAIGENYLGRLEDGDGARRNGEWYFHCPAHHAIMPVGTAVDESGRARVNVTVREFCAKLFEECEVCMAEGRGEGEDSSEVGDDDAEVDESEEDWDEFLPLPMGEEDDTSDEGEDEDGDDV